MSALVMTTLSHYMQGLGTWSWGNQLLWGYDEAMDPELQQVFDLATSSGINLFDTADSYGTSRLNGRSEKLLGQFIREYPGSDTVRSNLHVATKVHDLRAMLPSELLIKHLTILTCLHLAAFMHLFDPLHLPSVCCLSLARSPGEYGGCLSRQSRAVGR